MKKWVFILLLIISIVLIGLGIAGAVVGAHHTITKDSDKGIHQFYLIGGIIALIIGLISFIYLIYVGFLKKKKRLDVLQPEYFVTGAYTGKNYTPWYNTREVTPNINGISYPMDFSPKYN